jgi:hypothetical protein
MTTAAAKRSRKAELRRSTGYVGDRVLGSVIPSENGFSAYTETAVRLGDFPDEQSAIAPVEARIDDKRDPLPGGDILY